MQYADSAGASVVGRPAAAYAAKLVHNAKRRKGVPTLPRQTIAAEGPNHKVLLNNPQAFTAKVHAKMVRHRGKMTSNNKVSVVSTASDVLINCKNNSSLFVLSVCAVVTPLTHTGVACVSCSIHTAKTNLKATRSSRIFVVVESKHPE